ncbi:Gfo/Idh/MocA family protein [Rubrivirga litoralis]|uniref:Gfo/Idh/MocA family oxidoreductase n=1 Tax=Rubrivirga litoralis TaxID=3075598 RepID=A0ABU3BLT9_9BACT|nr:Gfo/Idh/MocA family oxidoreductase [Rubrivirga sp. F394]MDT0630255.1 Gfo/Idh/MocA family oxidoreductase [Rubrivirga sp. F394]
MNRRDFARTAAFAAAAPLVVPRHVLGGAGHVAPSDAVVVGVIGAGGMGASNAAALAVRDDVRIAALADVDMGRVAEAVEGRLASDDPGVQRAGRALRDAYAGAATYADFREMLERESGLDAVVVATPDHMHALAALDAMGRGLHVYCQKPLTYTVEESRLLRDAAAASGVITQMGNQGHSGDDGRRVVEVVRAGVLGPVREVLSWTNRPNGWWPQGVPLPAPEPAPPGLPWDLYLGPNEEQPYRPGIHPFGWRGFVGFGVGSLGDMGAHLVDFPVWALDLPRPARVETRHTPWGGGADDKGTYPLATITDWTFPTAGPQAGAADPGGEVRMTWYDGGLLPPTPESAPDGFTVDPNGGVIFVGERGLLVHETYGRNPRFLPAQRGGDTSALEAAAAAVPQTLPRVEGDMGGHEANWVRAIQGTEPISCPFDYGAHLNEIMLLGIAAMNAGKPITVDPGGAVTNVPDSDALLSRRYRAGWGLNG